jgi:hypothetical protein
MFLSPNSLFDFALPTRIQAFGIAIVFLMVQGAEAMTKSIVCIVTIRGIYH